MTDQAEHHKNHGCRQTVFGWHQDGGCPDGNQAEQDELTPEEVLDSLVGHYGCGDRECKGKAKLYMESVMQKERRKARLDELEQCQRAYADLHLSQYIESRIEILKGLLDEKA